MPEVEEDKTSGRIRNNEEAHVESNISKAYAAKDGNDDITISRNDVSCSSVFFQPLCCSGTFCKCLRYSWNLMQCSKCLYCYNRVELWLRIFRPRQFRSVSAEPLTATYWTLRLREPQLKNNDVASWPEPINHNIRVELVKAGPEKASKNRWTFPIDYSSYKRRR